MDFGTHRLQHASPTHHWASSSLSKKRKMGSVGPKYAEDRATLTHSASSAFGVATWWFATFDKCKSLEIQKQFDKKSGQIILMGNPTALKCLNITPESPLDVSLVHCWSCLCYCSWLSLLLRWSCLHSDQKLPKQPWETKKSLRTLGRPPKNASTLQRWMVVTWDNQFKAILDGDLFGHATLWVEMSSKTRNA